MTRLPAILLCLVAASAQADEISGDWCSDLAAHLRPGGRAILSGILNEQADDVSEVYARSGINEASRTMIGDWTTLVLAKPAR